jgi:hypothetical protein
MCRCAEKPNFNQKLKEARKLTADKGAQYVVYFMKAVGQLFVGPESAINDSFGVCCYMVPTESGFEEKEYVSGLSDMKMEVNDATDNTENTVAELTNEIGDVEFAAFIDDNTVSKDRLDSIAAKTMRQENLTEREMAIFSEKNTEIERIIKNLAKVKAKKTGDGK